MRDLQIIRQRFDMVNEGHHHIIFQHCNREIQTKTVATLQELRLIQFLERRLGVGGRAGGLPLEAGDGLLLVLDLEAEGGHLLGVGGLRLVAGDGLLHGVDSDAEFSILLLQRIDFNFFFEGADSALRRLQLRLQFCCARVPVSCMHGFIVLL